MNMSGNLAEYEATWTRHNHQYDRQLSVKKSWSESSRSPGWTKTVRCKLRKSICRCGWPSKRMAKYDITVESETVQFRIIRIIGFLKRTEKMHSTRLLFKNKNQVQAVKISTCKTDVKPVSKKKAKLPNAGTDSDGSNDWFRIMEEEVRHCFQRHPMSTTDLLANILKKLKPEQTRRKGTLHFTLLHVARIFHKFAAVSMNR
ncbi:General transcription factor IIF subunit [Trichinella spiralis]|uniref:General transcription factor IIF subunit n=1 Tax=Trichinella spiralis TaxID=6334 RepID=A0ABR3KXD4_TRISP